MVDILIIPSVAGPARQKKRWQGRSSSRSVQPAVGIGEPVVPAHASEKRPYVADTSVGEGAHDHIAVGGMHLPQAAAAIRAQPSGLGAPVCISGIDIGVRRRKGRSCASAIEEGICLAVGIVWECASLFGSAIDRQGAVEIAHLHAVGLSIRGVSRRRRADSQNDQDEHCREREAGRARR